MEFADGISALIGPNGSGKSNIVDAIKWVLGEQSMKKLRGSDATDVIFNGAAGRAAMGAAEVTLTFDNRTRIFDLDTPEVHITRRIYRSGEGEYLINRQGSRLKDIKDLLSGTGLGTQAYSIIEQGRVEGLLQNSPVQRRVIFEEAAGISRFNARKQEAMRRLERVDQMMVRISDIVSEVQHQLQTARNQAGKAQLYREYSSRLQEIRLRAGREDYRRCAAKIEKLQVEVDQMNAAAEGLTSNVEEGEAILTRYNSEIETVDLELRRFESDIAAIRQRISGEESNIDVYKAQVEELEADIVHNGRQLVDLNDRSGDIEDMMQKTAEELRKARRSTEDQALSYRKLLVEGNVFENSSKEKREEKNRILKEIETITRQSAKLAGSIDGLESKRTALQSSREQSGARLEKLEEKNRELALQAASLKEDVSSLEVAASQKLAQIDEAKQRKSAAAKDLARLSQELSEQKQRQSGMRERISVLEELIRKNEGLNPGVKAVLQQSRDEESPFRYVFGLVADLFRVDVEAASLIELALGPNAQKIVVSPKRELFKHTEQHAAEFPGRVTLTWLDPTQKAEPWDGFTGKPGVIGRADRFVKADPKFAELVHRLLGKTWIVENIAVARKLYKESDNLTQFVTISGEMLTPDGSLGVGPLNTSSGIITRRSELRTLGEQMKELDAAVAALDIEIETAKERVTLDEIDVEAETAEYQKAVVEHDRKRIKYSTIEERFRQSCEQEEQLREEIEKLDARILKVAEECKLARESRETLDERFAGLDIEQIAAQRELENAECLYAEHLQRTTNAKIELAKSEERLESLEERIRQFEEHLKERRKMLSEHRRRIRSLKERRESLLLSILRIESALASLYLKKEDTAKQARSAYGLRHDLVGKRADMQTDLKRLQLELQKLQTKSHAKQIDLERRVQERKTLVDRMREDYDIDLTIPDPSAETDIDEGAEHGIPETSDETVDYRAEIDVLRNKIQRLGSVNLEAIETLEELESRYDSLSTQYNDIIESKKAIEKIIERNNADSRRLFEETFEGVKLHFRELFQQLFGGGVADLVLENPDDILESGIDIVAKPPGKELKSVTLLSGGEKTMTCVALLLAFFRFRPNPVCILDECDAALDEGNIDRFVRVIKEFRTETQFLMITHSRQTMAAATSIYGVTMQESGVSKPISVQFTDISENGEFSVREAA